MDLSLLGERIKLARTGKGLTLEKLSEKIGISRNFLWEIEDGRKAPALPTFYNICDALNVSADFLFGFLPSDSINKESNPTASLLDSIKDFNEKELTLLSELLKTYNKTK